MKLDAMKTAAKTAFYKNSLRVRKNSPIILIVAGVVGVVAGTVMACHATLQAPDILKEHEKRLADIEECKTNDRIREECNYTDDIAAKDTFLAYRKTCFAFAKLYAPAVFVSGASVAAIIGSHHILMQRNAALATAYSALAKTFKNYRGRVIERFGETVDQELKTGVKKQKIEETEVDPETGKEKKVKTEADVFDGVLSDYSPYARFFDETCVGCWQKDPEYNLMFLRSQQKYFNDMLVTKGYVWLNQVYEALGMQITKEGQKIGWVYDPKDPELANYIDFGIYDIRRPAARKFVNGYERSILLDFNVDGDIWARMK